MESVKKPLVEVKLLAGGRILGGGELLRELLGDLQLLELSLVSHEVPKLDPDKDPLEQLATLKDMIMCETVHVQLGGVEVFRKLLSIERNPPIDQIIQAGVISRLVHLCRTTDMPKMQCEAAWALTNVASGTTEHTRCVV